MAIDCILNSGNQISGCKGSNQGGTSAFFIAPFSSSTIFTTNVDEQITNISGITFYKFDLPKQVASAKNTPKSNLEAGTLFYDSECRVVINKVTPTVRNKVKVLAQSVVHIIEYDKNGYYWLHGKVNGCDLIDGSEMDSGTKNDDPNRATLVFGASENDPKINITALSGFTYSY